jgi:hypothetical protein
VNRRLTTVTCAVAIIVILLAAGLAGVAQFSGLRFTITWPTFTPPKQTLLQQPTQSPRSSAQPQQPGAVNLDWLAIVLWVLIAAAVVFAVLLVLRWLRRRPPRTLDGLDGTLVAEAPPSDPEPEEPDAPVVQRGVELALRLLESEREPGDAIVKAWLGLQETAEDSGIRRRPAETPSEFTARILRRVHGDGTSVTTLLNLYERVRFGDHPASETDVSSARRALTELASSWDATPEATGIR